MDVCRGVAVMRSTQAVSVMVFAAIFAVFFSKNTYGQATPPACNKLGYDPEESVPLKEVTLPPIQVCRAQQKNGYPLPDPNCTPGAINPSITLKALQDGALSSRCVRDSAMSDRDKNKVYGWYGITKPRQNFGASQTCELDYLIPLELGGANDQTNLWPLCGPDGARLPDRFFKQKNLVEAYLVREVMDGRVELSVAQTSIAADWSQYSEKAKSSCRSGDCR